MFTRKRASTLAVLMLVGILIPAGGNASSSFTYDLAGRATTALYDNGTCVTYAYDPAGNRTAVNITASGPGETPNWGSGVWGCFSWTHQ